MKKYLLLLASMVMFFLNGNSQTRFSHWLDDDHYVISVVENGESQRWKVNPADGSKVKYDGPLTIDERFMRGLPSDPFIRTVDDDLEVKGRRVTNDRAKEENPQVSPDSNWVAYTKGGNLFVYDVKHERNQRLTDDGSEHVLNGYASWVYYEEILGRSSRFRAFYWSPDSKHIAFLQFDDRPVPTFTLARAEGVNGNTEVARYPKPGDPNPDVRLGIVNVESRAITWVDENTEKDQYTAWCFWTPNGNSLVFQELNRDQDTLDLVRYDISTGNRTHILQEVQPTWVDFVEEIHFLADGQEFLWPSRRSGWKNWYRYDLSGNLMGSIGEAEFDYSIENINEAAHRVIAAGAGAVSTDWHLFKTSLSDGALVQITSEDGWHTSSVSPSGSYIRISHSAFDKPNTSYILSHEGERLQSISGTSSMSIAAKVEPFEVIVDGYELPGYMVLPVDFSPDQKYPVVFSIYGGPGSVSIRNRYRDFSDDFMATHGIIRVAVDHRGSGKFGKKGLNEMHRNLGTHEIDDLVAVVEWLRKKPYIDDTRIGITGGSYGGYVTAMALTYGAEYFTHGVSLFPVTDWQLYDNVYTERYMDTPASNPVGYAQGSAMTHANNLRGKLLIVHGMADDNVHAQNTMQLISEFQKLGKEFELMVYPGKRHGWGGPERSHLTQLTEGFWLRHFGL